MSACFSFSRPGCGGLSALSSRGVVPRTAQTSASTRVSSLGIPSLALPAKPSCLLIMSSALWPRIFVQDLLAHLSTRQVNNPACCWIVKKCLPHSQAACYGIEIALLATGFVVQCATGVQKECHPVSETVSSFQRMLHVSPVLPHSSD